MAMDFLGVDPARTVKYHGFTTTPPNKFHGCFSNDRGSAPHHPKKNYHVIDNKTAIEIRRELTSRPVMAFWL
jgi:hypothetical protein